MVSGEKKLHGDLLNQIMKFINMKTNIIIGRFQIDKLTKGHKHLIDSAMRKRKADTLVFLLGVSPLSYTDINPLPAKLREKMLRSTYPNCVVKYLYDNPSDIEWSAQVDSILSKFKHPVLFGSRDCFISHYQGKHKFIEISQLHSVSATDIRKIIGSMQYDSPKFREGIIHAAQNRFPTAYATVDIAVLRQYPTVPGAITQALHKTQLLLGRKPGRTKFCFPGGFVDPTDESLEQAAGRELLEEVPGISTHELKYVASTKVNDFRYKGTKDGIMTSLFVTYILGGSTWPGDDLEETKWFDMANFDMNILSEHHHPLFEMLKKHLKL